MGIVFPKLFGFDATIVYEEICILMHNPRCTPNSLVSLPESNILARIFYPLFSMLFVFISLVITPISVPNGKSWRRLALIAIHRLSINKTFSTHYLQLFFVHSSNQFMVVAVTERITGRSVVERQIIVCLIYRVVGVCGRILMLLALGVQILHLLLADRQFLIIFHLVLAAEKLYIPHGWQILYLWRDWRLV